MEFFHANSISSNSISGKFAGSIGEYDDAMIECPSNMGTIILALVIVSLFLLCLGASLWYLCKVPKPRRKKEDRTVAPEQSDFRAMEVARKMA